eukprot:546885-Alexandrium_andersonii.AAC.1
MLLKACAHCFASGEARTMHKLACAMLLSERSLWARTALSAVAPQPATRCAWVGATPCMVPHLRPLGVPPERQPQRSAVDHELVNHGLEPVPAVA